MTRLARIACRRHGNVVVVEVSGEIDRSNRIEVRERILESAAHEIDALVLDLASTGFLDTAGVDLLFECERRLRMRGKRFILSLPEAAIVRRTLTISRVDLLIPTAPDPPAALELAHA